MANNEAKIEKLNTSLGTFEERFKKLTQGTQEYEDALEELVDRITKLKDLDIEREERLSDYLKSLEHVKDSWSKVNEFVETNIAYGREYMYQVNSVRNTLSDIVGQSASIRVQINEQLAPIRTLRNLSGELERSLEVQRGLEEKSLRALDRKIAKNIEITEYDVRRIAGLSKEASLLEPDANTKAKIEQAQLQEQAIIRGLRSQLTSYTITAREKAQIQDLIRLHETYLEKLDLENLSKVEGLGLASRAIEKDAERVRLETTATGVFSKVADKFGLTEVADAYEGFVQKVVKTQQDLGAAKQAERDASAVRVNVEKSEEKRVDRARREADRADIQERDKGYALTQLKVDKRSAEAELKTLDPFSSVESLNRAIALQEFLKRYPRLLADAQKAFAQAKAEAAAKKAAIPVAEQARDNNIEAAKLAEAAAAQKVVDTEKTLGGLRKSNLGALKSMVKALSPKIFTKLLPQAMAADLIFKILGAFKEVNVEAAELKRRVGSWEIATAAVNSELASSVDWLKTATELSDFTGLNSVTLFDKNQIAQASEFKNLTGASAQAANNLLIRSKLLGQSADNYRKSLTQGANEGNRLNRSVITLREVQNGVLEASNAISLSYGNNAEELGRAVVAAKNLGLELAGVERISDNLLDFESSIANEMQAQLLTGMSLNLQKAREFALTNDLEGVASEIQRQGVTAAKFEEMNRIQQEGIAKALGMSREELSKSLILRELNNGASAEALAAATGMKKEQIEALDIQRKWGLVVDKLVQSFTPLLDVVLSLIDPVAAIISKFSKLFGYISTYAGLVFRTIAAPIEWILKGLDFILDKASSVFGLFSENFLEKGLDRGVKLFNKFTESASNLVLPNAKNRFDRGFGDFVTPAEQEKPLTVKVQETATVQNSEEIQKAVEEYNQIRKDLNKIQLKTLDSGDAEAIKATLGLTEEQLDHVLRLREINRDNVTILNMQKNAVQEASVGFLGYVAVGTTALPIFRKIALGIRSIFSGVLRYLGTIYSTGKSIVTGIYSVVSGKSKIGSSIKAWAEDSFFGKKAISSQTDGKVEKASKATEVVDSAKKVGTVSGTGKGLRALGRNIAGFFTPFDKVTAGSIGKAAFAVGTVLMVSLPALLAVPVMSAAGSVSGGLKLLGRNIAGFFTSFSKVTIGNIGKVALALLPIAGLAAFSAPLALLSATGYVSKGLPILGRNIAGFFRAAGRGVSGAASFSSAMIAAVPGLLIFTGAAIGLGFALNLLAPTVESLGVAISNIITALIPSVEAVGNAVSSVLTTIGTVCTDFANIVGTAISGVLSSIGSLIEKGLGGVSGVLDSIGGLAVSVSNSISTVLGSIVQSIKGIVGIAKEVSLEDLGKLGLLGTALVAFGGQASLAIVGIAAFAVTGLPILSKIGKALGAISDGTVKLPDLRKTLEGLGTVVDPLEKIVDVLGRLSKVLKSVDGRKLKGLTVNIASAAVPNADTLNRGIFEKKVRIAEPKQQPEIKVQQPGTVPQVGPQQAGDSKTITEVSRKSEQKVVEVQKREEKESIDVRGELREVKNLLAQLCNISGREQVVVLDGYKVGTALAVGSTRM